MLVEHTFVTTIPGEEAMLIATRWLRSAGFKSEPCTVPNRRKFTAGLDKPEKAKSPRELPQRVWIENDRQRITVATSIELLRKPLPIHNELLVSIASSVQEVMENGLDEMSVPQGWHEAQSQIDKREKREGRVKKVLLAFVILMLVGLFAALIADAMSRN